MARDSCNHCSTGRRHSLPANLRRALGGDHNPLCRPADRALSRLWLAVPSSLLLAAVLACVTAFLTLWGAQSDARAAAAHLHRAEAVLLTAAGQPYTSPAGSIHVTQQAEAVWTSPAGQAVTGQVAVPENAQRGSTTVIWTNDAGRPAAAPRSAAALHTDAISIGIGTMTGLSLLAVLGLGLRRRSLARHCADGWQEAWERVEPTWSGRARGTPDEPGI